MKVLIGEKVLITDLVVADTFFKRLRGLMFYKEMPCKALMIKPCNSIHTYFMKFDIDVFFLDDNLVVVHKVEGLTKGKMIMPVKSATSVIEVENGRNLQITIGDILSIC